MQRLPLAMSIALALSHVAVAQNANDEMERTLVLAIETTVLDSALIELAQAAELRLIGPAAATRNRRSQPLQGTFTLRDALDRLLSGTPLTYEFVDARTIAIHERSTAVPTSATEHRGDARVRLVAAQTDQSAAVSMPVPTGSDRIPEQKQAYTALEEVTVTAARREQLSSDLPGALQVFKGADLDRLGADGFDDYLLAVPGVSFRDQGNGGKRIALRGVSNFSGADFNAVSTATPVGLYLNDLPISGTSVMPDLALFDLRRVEVLKGPQGTLYGEGAMGGSVRMVLNSPDPTQLQMQGDAALSSVERGEWNYRVRGVVNVPLSDRTGMRVAGTWRDDGGYVDNIHDGHDDHNGEEASSLRLLLNSRLSDSVSAELLLLRDAQRSENFSQVDLSLRDLQIDSPERQSLDQQLSVAGLTVKVDLGFAELTAASSYLETDKDLTYAAVIFQNLNAGLGLPFFSREEIDHHEADRTFTQELRLVSSGDRRLDWIAGAFYKDTEQAFNLAGPSVPEDLPALNAALVAAGIAPLYDDGPFWTQRGGTAREQVALYAEINFALTQRLEMTTGLRWYHESSAWNTFSTLGGWMRPFSDTAVSRDEGGDEGVVSKLGLSYRISDDSLVYALASSGFRAPAPNVISASTGVGRPFASSDDLWNYELGAKTKWLDGRLQVDGAVYFVDWKRIQATEYAISPITGINTGFVGNGGDGEIRGVELEVHAAPTEQLRIGVTSGYTDSELVRSTSNAFVGQRMPSSPEWTGSVYGEYRLPMAGLGEAFIHIDAQYVDDVTLLLTTPTTGPDNVLSSYAIGNLTLGLDSQRDWNVSLFVTNLWDERAVTGRGLGFANQNDPTGRSTIVPPRTFGVMYSRKVF